jgi:hypothetical protein
MDRHRNVVGHGQGIQRGLQQGRVVPVGRRGHRGERDAGGIDRQRALHALLASIHWAASGHLAAAGRLGDTAIDGEVGQVQTDHPIVGVEHEGEKRVHHAERDPRVPAAAQRRRGATRVGDAVVGTAEDEDLDGLVEHEPVGDARPVTAQRVGIVG